MANIYFARIQNHLTDHLINGLEFIHWREIIEPGANVFIKPNFTWPDPRPGVTTSPQFIDAIIPILNSIAGKVVVGKSNGGTFDADEAAHRLGVMEILRKHNVKFVNLSNQPAKNIQDVVAGKKISIQVSQYLLEQVDVFITMPVLKTHVVTGVTLGLKNQWGCIPSPKRLMFHPIMNYGITVLNRAYQPRIAILDGTYALDRRGPLEGDPIPTDVLAISDDVVALDAMGTHLLGLPVQRIRHIQMAAYEKLGNIDLKSARINQPLPEPVIKATIRPNLMDWIAIIIYRDFLLSKLAFNSPFTPFMYRLMNRIPPGTMRSAPPPVYENPSDH